MLAQNLWPDMVAHMRGGVWVEESAPSAVLKRQADMLNDLTNGILRAELMLNAKMDDHNLWWSLYVIAPGLQNYRVQIASLRYNPGKVWPVCLMNSLKNCTWTPNNEEEYLEALRALLQSDSVQKVLSSLIRESGV